MKTFTLSQTGIQVSQMAYGCMQIGGTWDDAPLNANDRARARSVIERALEHGINFFDHADIYCRGKSETVFAQAIQDLQVPREKMILQSKCGIRFANDPAPGVPTRFEFSYEHIMRTVQGSLKRLQTDYLDILLLHRPDALVEPEEVARALDELHRAGLVRHFGVSNHTWAQIELLKKYVTQPLIVNQVEINLVHADLIDDGLFFNTAPRAYTGIGGTLDYCRAHNILLQAWAPVAGGALINPPPDASPTIRAVATMIAEMARTKNTTREAIALAWLLKHPAGLQPILGTTKPERVTDSCRADEIELTHAEWYLLLETARGRSVP